MNGDHNSPASMSTEQQFYRVEKSATGQPDCQCINCVLWTVTCDDPEPTEIGTSWVGDGGMETARDVCDLMNMAYDRGQESRQETITGLCDRLDRINNLTHRRPAHDPYGMLREIEEWSGGFAKVPA